MIGLRKTMASIAVALLVLCIAPIRGDAAPYAALVMDARTGEVLHARSADRKLHPASLTKMMTLYLAFEAVRTGELRLDQKVRVSRRAARQVPSKIGLKAGRRVTIKDLIRATAVKSANDASVALGEAIGGSEIAFANLMTKKARKLGMKNTTFRNASGLTHSGQRSTARDMAILGRRLFYDYPQYYNLFGRKKTRTYGKTVYSTNRRLLSAYEGADGIKTGYTNAAGFNLVSSAKRGSKRIIAVVFGGKSSRSRNRRVAELLDMGFKRAPRHAAVVKTSRVATSRSPLPIPRPGTQRSLIARAGVELGNAIAPAAHASNLPIKLSAYAPLVSPSPLRRPGGESPLLLATTPQPKPEKPASDKQALSGWAVQLGVFAREETAIAELASVALSDINGLQSAGRDVLETELSGQQAWRAQLTGFDQSGAKTACTALRARGKECFATEAVSH